MESKDAVSQITLISPHTLNQEQWKAAKVIDKGATIEEADSYHSQFVKKYAKSKSGKDGIVIL